MDAAATSAARAREAALRRDAALRRGLLAWYRREARDLPWRRTRDPYAVWVSEVMLQQTRVDVATPYYLRWMTRFPTVAALATADEEDVMRLWAGLGYYSRARNLHAAAKAVVAQGGALPASAATLRALPGVGDYTAGAISSIAFGKRVPAVDGNVVRVLARLAAWPGAASAPRLRAKVAAWAARLVPADAPGDWNQALMDLGATVCTPRSQRCGACPVAEHCEARALGRQDRIPAPKRTTAAPVERKAFAVVERGGRILLVRNPRRGLLAGMWSLPGGAADEPLTDVVLAQAGVAIRLHGGPAAARHQFSHRTWEISVHRAKATRAARLPTDGGSLAVAAADVGAAETAWVHIDQLDGHALPAAMRVALAAVGVGSAGGVGRPKRRDGSGQA